MKSGKSRATILGFPLFAVLAVASVAVAQHAAHAVPSIPHALLERPLTLRTGVGAVHDDAGTKSPEAQRFYDQGLAYLHNYIWIEAARSFHQALKTDPNLALAHVGLSYAYIELNKPVESKQAISAAQKSAANPATTSSVMSTRARCRWQQKKCLVMRRSWRVSQCAERRDRGVSE